MRVSDREGFEIVSKSNAKTKELDYQLNVSGAKLFVYLEDLRKLLALQPCRAPSAYGLLGFQLAPTS